MSISLWNWREGQLMLLPLVTFEPCLCFKVQFTLEILERFLYSWFHCDLGGGFIDAIGRWCTFNRSSLTFLFKKVPPSPGVSSHQRRASSAIFDQWWSSQWCPRRRRSSRPYLGRLRRSCPWKPDAGRIPGIGWQGYSLPVSQTSLPF